MRTPLVIATRNSDKLGEIALVLDDLNLDLISADQVPDAPEVIEDQPTLAGNAVKKAVILSKATGMMALADDTGLEVEALKGAPGVRSSRYAGENATYDDNIAKLLAEMEGIPEDQRRAKFHCVIAVAVGDTVQIVEGICEGCITTARQGEGGFGYDPVFWVPGLKRTFAQMSSAQKNRISHRGRALRKSRSVIQKLLGA